MKTTPQKHQQEIYDKTRTHEYFAYFLEQGLGKTKIAIDVAFDLNRQKKISGVLVIAPNTVHLNWVILEMPKHAWFDVPMAYWKSNPRIKEKKLLKSALENDTHFTFVFMNTEAIRTPKGMSYAERFLESRDCLLVVDESTSIKNPRAKQTKAALKLSRKAKYRRILTGTPIAQGPLDLFSQIQFLSPKAIPITSYIAFKRSFAKEKLMVMGQRSFHKVVGYKNLDYLKKMIKPFSVRLTKDECTDLPDKVYSTHFVEMTKEQEALYKRIKDTSVAELTKERQVTGVVSATSVIAAMVKLQQIACGFVKDDNEVIHDIPNNRYDQLLFLLSDESEKYVVWTTFVHTIQKIKKTLSDKYGEASVVTFYGAVDSDKRNHAIKAFEQKPEVRFFVANRTASKGLTLTSSCRNIFFANGYNYEDRSQQEDRVHRIGQKRTCFYTDLIARNTLEENVLKRLLLKKKLSETVVTSDWQKVLTEQWEILLN